MEQSDNKKWLDIAETVSVFASVGGALASAIFQQVAIASIPLSLAVTFNWLNRQRIVDLINQSNQNNQANISQLISSIEQNKQELLTSLNEQIEKHQFNIQNLADQLKTIEDFSHNLNNRTNEIETQLPILESQQQKLEELVTDLQKIEIFSQSIKTHPNDSHFYYDRASSRQHLGDTEGAIEDYTLAIEHDANFAKAYENRGLVYVQINQRKKAVEDLRQAAKLYFVQGDIQNYQRTKQMSLEIHSLPSSLNNNNGNDVQEQLLISSLFSS